jgi:hypothetical protein
MNIYTRLISIKSFNQLKAFIEDGVLEQILSNIGDIHTESALISLKNMGKSSDIKREVELAIGHLQAAHVAYKKFYKGLNKIQRQYYYHAGRRACKKDQSVCIFMAMCYCYLNENTLMEESIDNAVSSLKFHKQFNDDDSLNYIAGLLNPTHYIDVIKDWNEDFSCINQSEIDEIADALREICDRRS